MQPGNSAMCRFDAAGQLNSMLGPTIPEVNRFARSSIASLQSGVDGIDFASEVSAWNLCQRMENLASSFQPQHVQGLRESCKQNVRRIPRMAMSITNVEQ